MTVIVRQPLYTRKTCMIKTEVVKIMKNKSIFLIISALLLIPLFATTALADRELTATRDISDQSVDPGDVFNVTLTLNAIETVVAPSLDEDLPVGWTVTPIDKYYGSFKASSTEWIWSVELLSGESIRVTYNVTVPTDAVPGVYNISGVVSAHMFGPYVTGGHNTVTIPPVQTPTVTPNPTQTATPEPTEISEFPIIAIPVMAILGMMFLLSRNK